MRFAAALSAPDELEPLAQAGADEVYFGLLEDAWRQRYGSGDSISRRQGAANLQSRLDMYALAAASCALGIPASLALNARVTQEQLPYLVELCADWAAHGGRSVIIRDIALMCALQKEKLPLKITASLLGVTVNRDGVEFMRSLGAKRVVLPRFLTIREMSEIAACADMEFEAMVFGDKCPMIDGYCRGLHMEKREHLCACMERAPDPCAACRLRELESAGITTGKLGGRGKPLAERLQALNFLNIARRSADEKEIKRLYRRVFGHACSCYYSREADR